MGKNYFKWKNTDNKYSGISSCYPYGGCLYVWEKNNKFSINWTGFDGYYYHGEYIYETLGHCEMAAVRWYKKKFRSGALIIAQHIPIKKTMLEAFLDLFRQPTFKPLPPAPDLLERLVTHNYLLPPDSGSSMGKDFAKFYLDRIIEDRANMGWGAYEEEMIEAINYDRGCIDLLIKIMQENPKSIPYNPGRSYMFSRSVGCSGAWSKNYEERQKVKENEIARKYENLGLVR